MELSKMMCKPFPWMVTEANNGAWEVEIIPSRIHYLVNIKFYLSLLIKWHPSTSSKALDTSPSWWGYIPHRQKKTPVVRQHSKFEVTSTLHFVSSTIRPKWRGEIGHTWKLAFIGLLFDLHTQLIPASSDNWQGLVCPLGSCQQATSKTLLRTAGI